MKRKSEDTIPMVFGSNGDGGRYGALGEAGCSTVSSTKGTQGNAGSAGGLGSGGGGGGGGGGGSNGGGGGRSSGGCSGSCSSSSSLDDLEDGHMTHDVYQRQPLLTNHDAFVHTNGLVKDASGYYNGDNDCSNGVVKIPMPMPHREEPRFPKEKFKTLIAFIFLFCNWIFTTASLALTHERVPDSRPLPDITLDSVNVQEWGLNVAEIIIIVAVYVCVVVVLFHKHRFILFRRIFIILGLLYFYRSITMYVTVLPVANPHYDCSAKANYTSFVLVMKRVVQLMSGFGLSINGQHTFCGDYIYSGHTVCLVIAYLIVREYTPRRWWPLHWMFALLAVTGVVMVLIARGHYTVDCIIAYYITTRIFYMYHTLANNQNLKVTGPNNFFDRLWWYPMFQYFEKNVQGVVPRHYEWPLPWPRRWNSKNPQRIS